MNIFTTIAALLLTSAVAHADDFAARCADRAAIERVYHAHRLGTKQPFEQTMPRGLIDQTEATWQLTTRPEVEESEVGGQTSEIRVLPAAADESRRPGTSRPSRPRPAPTANRRGGAAPRNAQNEAN